MTFLRPLFLLASFSVVFSSNTFADIRHIGVSPEQEFLVCAQKVLGKVVLWQDIFYGARGADNIPKVACPMGRDEFIAALQQDEAISVFEDGPFAFLVTTGYSAQRKPNTFYEYKFKTLPILFNVRQVQREGSRKIPEEELQKIARAVLRETRGVEVLEAIGNSPGSGCTAAQDQIRVELDVEARSMGKDGPQAVISALRASPCDDENEPKPENPSDLMRLTYGEMKNGSYEMKWDSPLLCARSDWLTFRDLNGDGVDEIVIWPSNGQRVEQWNSEDESAYRAGVVAFDWTGNELTRAKFCSEYTAYSEERACPILAKKVEFQPAKSGGRLDLVTTEWWDSAFFGFKAPQHRFHLTGSHYEPEAAPLISAKPLHIETPPTKDVGLLLGLKQTQGITSEYSVYRTLWITRTAERVSIDASPNLLVPRRDGFWAIGSNISSRDNKKEEFVWRIPIEKQVAVHELSDEEAAGLPDDAANSRPIDFVSAGYIGLASANYTGFESFHIFSLDDGTYEHPVDISSILGPASWVKFSEAKPEGSALDVPVSMQYSCHVEVKPANWDLVRDAGHWFVQGWGAVGGACNGGTIQTYMTTIRPPTSIAGFDELPVTWEQIIKAFPQAIDAFGAPTWGELVVLTTEEVLVCPVTQAGIGKPLGRLPLLAYEKPIMAQWAVGKFVASWTEQFQHFKANPGPYHELPAK
jgi:hypothetical protein